MNSPAIDSYTAGVLANDRELSEGVRNFNIERDRLRDCYGKELIEALPYSETFRYHVAESLEADAVAYLFELSEGDQSECGRLMFEVLKAKAPERAHELIEALNEFEIRRLITESRRTTDNQIQRAIGHIEDFIKATIKDYKEFFKGLAA